MWLSRKTEYLSALYWKNGTDVSEAIESRSPWPDTTPWSTATYDHFLAVPGQQLFHPVTEKSTARVPEGWDAGRADDAVPGLA
jgi:hypothetical protein